MDDLDLTPNYLLTHDGNPKTDKSIKYGYLTAIMHLAPARLAGFEVCAHKTTGCEAACLNTSGHGGINLDANGLNPVQRARIRRTRFMRRDPEGFARMLQREVETHLRRAKRHGLTPCFRLNGTSDLPFERKGFHGYRNIMEYYDTVQWYDYTKYPAHLRDTSVPNYHLTFSLAESNRVRAIEAIRADMNVAAVFRAPNGDLPATVSLGGRFRRVIDGDQHDLRFLDPAGSVVGLRAKGRAKQDTSGFVLDVPV